MRKRPGFLMPEIHPHFVPEPGAGGALPHNGLTGFLLEVTLLSRFRCCLANLEQYFY